MKIEASLCQVSLNTNICCDKLEGIAASALRKLHAAFTHSHSKQMRADAGDVGEKDITVKLMDKIAPPYSRN